MTQFPLTTKDVHPPFSRTKTSFEERTGNPDVFSCAVGRVVIWFADLEQQITLAIHDLLGHDDRTGSIVTSEMSFKNRVHVMASLVREQASFRRFNIGRDPLNDVIDVLVARCFQAEELRNRVIHSSWEGKFFSNSGVKRKKTTAKATYGLRVSEEEFDAGYLLDIADFICDTAMFMEEFMFDPETGTGQMLG